MERYLFLPVIGVSIGALVLGHLGLTYLPPMLLGLPTALVLLAAVGGTIVSAIRFL